MMQILHDGFWGSNGQVAETASTVQINELSENHSDNQSHLMCIQSKWM